MQNTRRYTINVELEKFAPSQSILLACQLINRTLSVPQNLPLNPFADKKYSIILLFQA